MKPDRRWLVAASSLVLLTGCFDLLEEIWLETGGGARLKVEISVPKALLAMGRLGGQDLLLSVREDAANVKAELEKDPDLTGFEYRTEEDGAIYKLIYEIATRDATKLAAVQQRTLAAVAQRASSESPVRYSIQRRFGVVGHVFEGVVASERDSKSPAGDQAEEIAQAMAGAMLGGHAITLRLHAPAILSSNGEMDSDRTTAEWKIPLSKLVQPGFRQEMRAETLAVGWRMGAVLGAVGLLLVGMMIGRLTGRRR